MATQYISLMGAINRVSQKLLFSRNQLLSVLMLFDQTRWCVSGNSEGIDLPRLVQSILNRAGVPK